MRLCLWGEREEERLGRIVDPVDIRAVIRGRHRAVRFPPLQQDERALVPERQVSQDCPDRPACGHGAAEVGVSQALDESLEPRAFRVVHGHKTSIDAHGVPSVKR